MKIWGNVCKVAYFSQPGLSMMYENMYFVFSAVTRKQWQTITLCCGPTARPRKKRIFSSTSSLAVWGPAADCSRVTVPLQRRFSCRNCCASDGLWPKASARWKTEKNGNESRQTLLTLLEFYNKGYRPMFCRILLLEANFCFIRIVWVFVHRVWVFFGKRI